MLFENNYNDYISFGIDDKFYEKDNSKKLDLFPIKKGYLLGTIFENIYDNFDNYSVPELKARNEKEKMLIDIGTYDFALNDLNLYLDIHPKDKEAYQLFKEMVTTYDKLKLNYADKYGPLVLCDDKYQEYEWSKEPWPWEDYNV